jgi:hypothetical protein
MNITSDTRKKLLEAIEKEELKKIFYEEINTVWLDEAAKENYKTLNQTNSVLIKIAASVFNKKIFDSSWIPSIASIVVSSGSILTDSKEIANILIIYFSKEEIQEFLDEIDESILGNKPKNSYNRSDF